MKTFKKETLLLLLALLCILVSHAQESRKGLFNLTRIGYSNITYVDQSIFTPGRGETVTTLSNDGAYAVSLNNITGYFITNHLSLGIGFGLDGVHNPNGNTLPVFLDLRGYIGKDEGSLYSYFNVGPHIDPGIRNANFDTGVTVNFGVGYQLAIAEQLFQIDLAYNFKNLEAINPDNGIRRINKVEGFSLNIGIIFF
jgi:hypothetical protein